MRTKTTLTLLAAALCLSTLSCGRVRLARLLLDYEPRYTNADALDTTTADVTRREAADGRPATLLSAFFGIDNGLPKPADRLILDGSAGMDGMPVIFSHEVEFSTLQAGDFRVTTASGEVSEVLCVTLAPADDPGELRTVLVVGELGSAEDQPARVEVVGDLLSIDGSANFKGATVDVTPLEDGPTLVRAEVLPQSEWRVGVEATPLPWGGGSGAPDGAQQVVRVTWAGGVTKPGGDDVDDEERKLYRVRVALGDGSVVDVTPFAVADLGDSDNNHLLCLDVAGVVQSVSFPAGHLTDPREDLNPATRIDL